MGNCMNPINFVDESISQDEEIDVTPLKRSNLLIIFVLGGPGAGKGTQCERISKKYGFEHISSGELLREETSAGSQRGATIAKIMADGKLVPENVVLNLMKKRMMKSLKTTKGFLLDGYPRQRSQVKPFEKSIGSADLVLHLLVKDQIMRERLMGRALTSGRIDDNEETIKKRIRVFHENNNKILKYLKKKVVVIYAERDVDSVFNDVCKVVDETLAKRNVSRRYR